VARAVAPVWDVRRSRTGSLSLPKKTAFVNHYSFHIQDPEWGHITTKMAGQPLSGPMSWRPPVTPVVASAAGALHDPTTNPGYAPRPPTCGTPQLDRRRQGRHRTWCPPARLSAIEELAGPLRPAILRAVMANRDGALDLAASPPASVLDGRGLGGRQRIGPRGPGWPCL
jgi:hypothetical protein